jgi:hypothetical protein
MACLSLSRLAKRLQLISVRYLLDKSAKELQKAIDQTTSMYTLQKFTVVAILIDGESGIYALKSYVENQGVRDNPASKSEHIPEIERAIRLIKERVRIIWNGLPYKLCNVLVVHLVRYCVAMINLCPKSNSTSTVMSPKEIFTGRKVDVKRECRLAFGFYAQVHEDNMITNTMAPRSVGAIEVGSSDTIQGSYLFINLNTWKLLQRRSWTILPMPSDVVSALNVNANRDRSITENKNVPTFTTVGNMSLEDDDDIAEETAADDDVFGFGEKMVVPPVVALYDENQDASNHVSSSVSFRQEDDLNENPNVVIDDSGT